MGGGRIEASGSVIGLAVVGVAGAVFDVWAARVGAFCIGRCWNLFEVVIGGACGTGLGLAVWVALVNTAVVW